MSEILKLTADADGVETASNLDMTWTKVWLYRQERFLGFLAVGKKFPSTMVGPSGLTTLVTTLMGDPIQLASSPLLLDHKLQTLSALSNTTGLRIFG